jgi:hypothetical protein
MDGPPVKECPVFKPCLMAACVGLLMSTSAFAGDCAKTADEKKLAGAARASFIKKCEKDTAPTPSAACEKSATDKKLAGAARTSHIRKCMADEAAKKP